MTKALILVGGQGKRLRPLTCNLPKPMVPVLNLPFLEHIIRNLKEHDITDIILAQHYLADAINDHFGTGETLGVKLTYIMEHTPLGTAGAIKNVAGLLDDTFFVLNGDIFANRNFSDMLAKHRQNKAQATIALTPVEDPTIYGVVETADDHRVKRFLEKPRKEEVTTNMINAGTYVLEPEILKMIAPGVKVSIEREVFPVLLQENRPVFAYPSADYWMDAGTPEKYQQLQRDLLNGKYAPYVFPDDAMAGEKSRIHASVQTTGKVLVGDNCFIGSGVKLHGTVVIGHNCAINNDVVISDTIIWDNVEVGYKSDIQSSIIANDCVLAENLRLQDVIIGDHNNIEIEDRLQPGAIIYPPGQE